MSKGLINFEVQSYSEIWEIAKQFASTDLVPKEDKGKPANLIVKWQYGQEIGLSPMASLQNISVINGRPAVWGDALLALVRSHHEFEGISEEVKSGIATCKIKRKGQAVVIRTFSESDAQAAGLLGKPGPWKQYKDRMLQMRARGFAIRDAFADTLAGIKTVEEVEDYPIEEKEVSYSSKSKRLASLLSSESVDTEENNNVKEEIAGDETLNYYMNAMNNAGTMQELMVIFAEGYKKLKEDGLDKDLETLKASYEKMKLNFQDS